MSLVHISVSCTPSIEKHEWKYGQGFHIGDWLIFYEYYQLRNDTIFIQDQPRAVIIDDQFSRVDSKFTIKDIQSDSLGVYYRK